MAFPSMAYKYMGGDPITTYSNPHLQAMKFGHLEGVPQPDP